MSIQENNRTSSDGPSDPAKLEAELRLVNKERGLLMKEARRLASEVRQLHATQRFLQDQLEKERRRGLRLRRSLSWRLTRPLRSLGGALQALVRVKKAEQLDTRHAADLSPASHQLPPEARVAVVIHAFYPDLFRELAAAVAAAGFPFDLFVTCPTAAIDQIKADLGSMGIEDAVVLGVANRGRDVAPFLRVLPEVRARGFRLLLKLHTKRSAHRDDGATWRSSLVEPLLSPAGAAAAIHALWRPGEYGIVGPSNHIVPLSKYPGANLERVRQLADDLGVDQTDGGDIPFVAGTMFFARVDALTPLLRLTLDETDFEPEVGQIDGTLAHAIERLFSFSAQAAGYRLASLDERTAEICAALPAKGPYPFGVSAA
jgi:lipopolysaccharide biosynthesis protein